ncbi:hypothetical protein BN938_0081 [Mucinivorans hirudinis]|uniref:Uncharacterized protein n=1 Tax=Mucinivorans hirudinis TaxID=1433126 RepID=A0A060R8W7_9BACT|nr:hypothetical protein BN938_0081 [Mucinivorans hirudinis]
MKSQKGFQPTDAGRKTVKLDPIRKSGKEKYNLYKEMEEEEGFDDEEFDEELQLTDCNLIICNMTAQ